MARPQKLTVDYFSHDANASTKKTLTILFNNFEHEGISAWWQLLENISSANNHVIYLRNPEDLEYLAAKMRFKPERMKEILDKLAYLNAIDGELYKRGVIWCQNLVDRFKDVYNSRNQPLPQKPNLVDNNNVSSANNPVSSANNPVNLPDNTQTKLNKTKLNKTKNNKGGVGGTPDGVVDSFNLPEWVDLATWNAFLEVRKKKKAPNTEHALKLIVKELERLKADNFNPHEILNQSIMRGWTGVFPLSNGINDRGGQHGGVHGRMAPGKSQPSRVTARTEEYPMEAYYEGLK
jgi:hypothetical protein